MTVIAICGAIALAAAVTYAAARLELAIEQRRFEYLKEKLRALEEVFDGQSTDSV
jgi:hypothetical protein